MNLVDQFNAIERALPANWAEIRLLYTVEDERRSDRAASLLGPANPARRNGMIHFGAARRAGGLRPEAIRRLLRRLEREGITGKLDLVRVEEAAADELRERATLRGAWERSLATLPPDWTDLYGEVQLDSTDYVERAALLLAPLNPSRYGGPTGLRFRCARNFGYGVSPEMAARCLQRCDDERITGSVEILLALSDTYPVATQGPVWYVGGRSV